MREFLDKVNDYTLPKKGLQYMLFCLVNVTNLREGTYLKTGSPLSSSFVFYRNCILKFSYIAWSWLFRPRAVFIKAIRPTGNSLVQLTTFTHLSPSPVFAASLSSYGLTSVQFERPNVLPFLQCYTCRVSYICKDCVLSLI